MSKLADAAGFAAPPDQGERTRALDPTRSFLVQAPAGSGKTELLILRYLRLLSEVEKPDQIVAITFTNAAAAEMRQRILDALEKASGDRGGGDLPLASLRGGTGGSLNRDESDESLEDLAARALRRAKALDWRILEQPGQLRITTIDSFCRSLAMESPLSWGLLSGMGGRLEPVANASPLYRKAARRTLELLKKPEAEACASVEALLLWRDNSWKDVEDLIVEMLGKRDKWFHQFVFDRDVDWGTLRERLEAPFQREARERLRHLGRLLDDVTGCREDALKLARFACEEPKKFSPHGLAELAELPDCSGNFASLELLESAVAAYAELARFLLTSSGEWRAESGFNKHHGFPPTEEGRAAKRRIGELIASLARKPGLEAALAAFLKPVPLRYTEEEWQLVRHCFAVLRQAAVELKFVFAETGTVDFTEVAQIALGILAPDDRGFPSDLAIRYADGIRHLLVDEFQDTSRKQHLLLSRLIAAWPEREARSCFFVGDPMQSIYEFRDADVELFERTRQQGLKIQGPDQEPFEFQFVPLTANFRTVPTLVADLNEHFERIFAGPSESGVSFSQVVPARESESQAKVELHLAFTNKKKNADIAEDGYTREQQTQEIVTLIREKMKLAAGKATFRVAVLGRTKATLWPIAEALREAGVGFRAIELVQLRDRPEVLDALSLARALLNPLDRTAWLGVLRAPWCGLTLEDLHLIASADQESVLAETVPALLETRLPWLLDRGRIGKQAYEAAERVRRVVRQAVEQRSWAAAGALGTWLQSVWKALGGEDTVDEEAIQNLDLLWRALDGLPEDELDLLGPALDASLEELCALPDPEASSEFGVQLMTIHKAKGLEFEVVIVPALEVDGQRGERGMFSWLERGLVDGGNEEATEFLIAPIQTKGGDKGLTKAWVDAVKARRAKDEMRRVLYVAATRAREELHLFSRPRFNVKAATEWSLCTPTGLLATAWAAFGDEIEARFGSWHARRSADAVSRVLDSVAAQGDLLQMPLMFGEDLPTRLRRLPQDYIAPDFRVLGIGRGVGLRNDLDVQDAARSQFTRVEGGLESRLLGTAVHGLLEKLTRLRQDLPLEAATRKLVEQLPTVTSEIRRHGLANAAAQRLASEALAIAQRTGSHAVGAWITAPHADAQSESQWTAWADGAISTMRPDRVFFAGGPDGLPDLAQESWWVIDYKTSRADGRDLSSPANLKEFLSQHREQYRVQLDTYATVLRGLIQKEQEHRPGQFLIRAAIYYPRLRAFDFWEA